MNDLNSKSLSSVWNSAKPEDIGAGFKRANRAVAKKILEQQKPRSRGERRVDAAYRKIQFMDSKAERSGRDRHPFLNGNSRFIFYLIKKPTIVKRVAKNTQTPINFKNKVQPRQRTKFVSSLNENIDLTSKFLIEEILPKSQSLLTALGNVDEAMQQLTDEKAGLPVDFMKTKAREAIFLRIIRFLSNQYGLTKDEAKLLAAEFVAKAKPALF